MSAPDLRILVCCHKPAELVTGGVYTPIHCGRAVMHEAHKDGILSTQDKRWLLEHCIGDDTGDNISAKNRAYCELTAYYWAWKNYEKLGNPNYIGLTHYRRGFLPGASPKGGCIARFSTLSPELRALILDTERLNLGRYELYAPEHTQAYRLKAVSGRYDWTQRPPLPCRVVEKNPGNIGLPQTLDYVQAHYPRHSEHLHRYLRSRRAFQWNMAIFHRNIFFDYANYLFDVLQHVEKQVDSSTFNTVDRRFLAYLGEHLTGAFIFEMQHCVSAKFLPTFFVKKTQPGSAAAEKQSALLADNPAAERRLLRFLQLKRLLTWGKRRIHYTQKITMLEGQMLLSQLNSSSL